MRVSVVALSCILGAFAPSANANTSIQTVDEQRDRRLKTRMTATVYGHTLTQFLQSVSRSTGVEISVSPAHLKEQPIIVLTKNRSLGSTLKLLEREFRWGPRREFGCQWQLSSSNGKMRYRLVEDLKSRLEAEKLRTRDRTIFLEEVTHLLELAREAEAPQGLVEAMAPFQTFSKSQLRAAIEGERLGLNWHEMPRTLQAVSRRSLGEAGGSGAGSWVELSTEGEGQALRLSIQFRAPDGGGTGNIIQPQRYLQRLLAITMPRASSTSTLYRGAAARPVQLTRAQQDSWRKVSTLPQALRILHEATGLEVVSDDYGYALPPSGSGGLPASEPLGGWLDGLCRALTGPAEVPADAKGVEWREEEGAFLLRNPHWYAEDMYLAPAKVRALLQARNASPASKALSLQEATEIVSGLSNRQVASLERHQLIRPGQFADQQSFFRFLSSLSDLERLSVFNEKGLSFNELATPRRVQLTEGGAGRSPFINEWLIRNQLGGNITIRARINTGKLIYRFIPAKGEEFGTEVDLSLPGTFESVNQVLIEK
jgi:hypothetical protein